MKSIIIAIFTLICLFTSVVYAQTSTKIYFFYGNGCSHCAKVEQYFEENNIYSKYPIEKREVYSSHENVLLYNSIMDERGFPFSNRGIPAIIMGDIVLMGDEPIIRNFTSEADKYLQHVDNSITLNQDKNEDDEENPGLTIFAVIAGAIVDAINPCAFAVLIILMSTILATGKAQKALTAGMAFSISIFISYFLIGLGLYSALEIGNLSNIFYQIVVCASIILGLFNLKDYFWYNKLFLMEVPLSWRPKLKSLIHSVTSPLGAFFIGFLVSLFLLPCTSGPYIVILGMLAEKVMFSQALFYLILYNLIFVAPMVVISFAVYKGFDPNKAEDIRQKRLRLLHLIAGIVMLGMGIVVLLGIL